MVDDDDDDIKQKHFHNLFSRRFRIFNMHKVNCFMLVIELKSEFYLQSRKLG